MNFDKLSTYEKAFNCMKYGSDRRDTLGLSLPIPDLGALGFNIGNTAKYCNEICIEEIKRLDSARFFKDYSDTFDQECGRTLAGQYRQCVDAATRLGRSSQIQNLSCSLSQNRDGVIINTRYVPGAMEGPAQYRIASVKGMDGIGCERNVHAGVNQYNSFTCALPTDHDGGTLNVRLGNGVTCSMNVGPPVALQIDRHRRHSCSAIFSSLGATEGAQLPVMVQATLSGLCDICLEKNLGTGGTDQRSLESRLKNCAVWSGHALMLGEAQFCKVAAIDPTTAGGYIPFGNIGGMGMPSRPGTRLEISGGIAPQDGTALHARGTPCADIPPGWAISLKGQEWERIPIDFLVGGAELSPALQTIMSAIEAYFSGK